MPLNWQHRVTEQWWSVLQGTAALLLLYNVYINSAIFTSLAGAGIIYLLHIPGQYNRSQNFCLNLTQHTLGLITKKTLPSFSNFHFPLISPRSTQTSTLLLMQLLHKQICLYKHSWGERKGERKTRGLKVGKMQDFFFFFGCTVCLKKYKLYLQLQLKN